MTIRTYTHLYDSYPEAAAVVGRLEAAGIPHADISIVAGGHEALPGSDAPVETAANGAGAGASLGTVLGGGAGLLAGIGALAIPGVGPVVAAGWLIATLTGAGVGATAGGLLGSLVGAGVSDRDAHLYAEGVRRGGTLVTVRAEDTAAAQIDDLMAGPGRVIADERRTTYETEGWTRHDPGASPLPPGVIEAERLRTRGGQV